MMREVKVIVLPAVACHSSLSQTHFPDEEICLGAVSGYPGGCQVRDRVRIPRRLSGNTANTIYLPNV